MKSPDPETRRGIFRLHGLNRTRSFARAVYLQRRKVSGKERCADERGEKEETKRRERREEGRGEMEAKTKHVGQTNFMCFFCFQLCAQFFGVVNEEGKERKAERGERISKTKERRETPFLDPSARRCLQRLHEARVTFASLPCLLKDSGVSVLFCRSRLSSRP